MRRSLPALVAAVALLLTACTGMPEDGPVVDADVSSRVDQSRPSDFSPALPRAGASATDVVRGFFEAMQAWPISSEVARKFLTAEASEQWDPDAETITYSDEKLSPQLTGLNVTVPLSDAVRLGRTGARLGHLSEADRQLRFALRVEDGEYRISDPPDALVVPTSWFSQRFNQASLYFFDPSGRILVPEPVSVPRGDQLASTLISRLLLGPGDDLGSVDRSYLPSGLRLAASSVPVDDTGLAEVTLLGDPGTLTPEAVDRMLAQLAWTLAQDPEIATLRVTLGDEVLRGPDTDDEYAIDDALEYDPNGYLASDRLFAVRDDLLAVSEGDELFPVDGALGLDKDPATRIRTAAVNLDASRAAAVTADGRTLLLADLEAPADDKPAVAQPVLTGTDLLRPAWDFADRTWVVDRTAAGAVVRVVVDGRLRTIDVPQVSGRDVRSFLVSRDGTRFVAVVRGATADELRVGRVAVADRGGPDRVVSTASILATAGPQGRIRDVAWSAPNTLALLLPLDPAPIFEVRSVTVDGSPPDTEELDATLTDKVSGLVGSPVPGLPTYAVIRGSRLDLSEGGLYGFAGDPATSIGYVG